MTAPAVIGLLLATCALGALAMIGLVGTKTAVIAGAILIV